MTIRIPKLSEIPPEEQTPLVGMLLEVIHGQQEQIQQLKDEIARLKGQTPKPTIKPSTLEKPGKPEAVASEKRPGSAKRTKTVELVIHEEKVIKPEEQIPPGSRFKGYQDYVVQDIEIKSHNIVYRLERWQTPEGRTLRGRLSAEIAGSHFGTVLQSFILYQYYHAHVTQPLLLEQLHDWGIDISSGQLSAILLTGNEACHTEKDEILSTGLEISGYINVDDTGARHNGKNGYCTHIGNELFAWFKSTDSKSRINFLDLLRTGHTDYVMNGKALEYMALQGLSSQVMMKLVERMPRVLPDALEWSLRLDELGITDARHVRIATEGAMLGSLYEHGFNPDLVIVSDDAGQFNIVQHALCWIHTERLINKLIGFTEQHKQTLESTRGEIWNLYTALKQFKKNPEEKTKALIDAGFDRIFTKTTCFITLNQTLKRIHKNKAELLLVLKRPDIPLHNNTSENDIREYVKRRKISGSTRSDPGRQCRDTFTSLKKTCRKLGVSFWSYLNDRVSHAGHIPPLPALMRSAALN
jgi:hypothetical protein